MSTAYFSGYSDCKLLSSRLNGKLFTGRRESDNREVILKTPKNETPSLEESATLEHEYRIMEILRNSPSIPQLYGKERYGKSFFIVMEKINSPTLSDILAQKTKFDLKEFLAFALAAVGALENIHRFDIIHRDISEHNILYDNEKQECTIIDFGLSIPINHQKVIPLNPEVIEGTLTYISPEQSGWVNHGIDYRTDYYSLGVTFYRALTGKLPFFSEVAKELINAHLLTFPEPPCKVDPSIPEVVSDIILKLMEKEPESRYQSIVGIRYDLLQCIERLSDHTIPPFPIGSKDTFERFEIPEKIYGRKSEINILLDKYEAVAKGGSGLIMIGGYAGVGKTTLVHEMCRPVADKNGLLISGKFDRFKHNIPYYAFTQAFDEFVHRMLTEPDNIFNAFKEKVINSLGSNAQIIIDAVPSLETIIGSQPPIPAAGLVETQNRFAYVFQQFIRCLPSPEQPVALFLDDLQWADLASLRMLKTLLQTECPYLLIVGGYRGNEVDEHHHLNAMLSELKNENIAYDTLSLQPLKAGDVQELIADALHRKKEDVESIAEICYIKTEGNPFFLIEMLENFYKNDIIRYDWSESKWVWDVDKVRAARFTKNVVALMVENIQQLEFEVQSLLMIAACIGNRFTFDLLEAVWPYDPSRLRPYLEILLKKEFINCQEKYYFCAQNFQFFHDSIQQAAHDLFNPSNRIDLHMEIARQLEKRLQPDKPFDDSIFDIVDHYNRALDAKKTVIIDRAEKRRIADLNLAAAKVAKSAAAYEVALNYCQTSEKWLTQIDWENDYSFLIELYSEAMECGYLSRRFELLEEYGREISKHSKHILDEVRAMKSIALYYNSKGEHEKAVALLLRALKQLGINIPKHPGKIRILKDLIILKATHMLKMGSISDLANLPIVNDKYTEAVQDLIVEISPSSYLIGNITLFSMLYIQALGLIFHKCNSKKAAAIYAPFGIILVSIGSIENAFQFGKLSLAVADNLDDPIGRTTAIYVILTFIFHWKKELNKVTPSLLQNFENALDAGNTHIAAYNLVTWFSYSFYSGTSLLKLLDDMKTYEKILLQIQNKDAIRWFHRLQEVFVNLVETKSILSMKKKWSEPPEETGKALMYANKLMLAVIFRDFEQASEAHNNFAKHKLALTGHYLIALFYFYKTLTLIALLKGSSFMERFSMKREIRDGISHFKNYAKHCPSNHLNKYLLLKAEWSRAKNNERSAKRFYQEAIECSAKNNFLQEEALASELAGRFYIEQKKESSAIHYLQRAFRCYEDWGAKNKVERLEKEFDELLKKS